MGIQQSNLSNTGFDYVVAVSQDSINATLEEYLWGGLNEVILCYIYDANNNPQPIDFKTFVASANNTDPFTIPDGTPGGDPKVNNLNNANFAFAIKAKLGIPANADPSTLPPIIALKPGQSNVTYTMMFSEFVATELVFGARGRVTWVNQSQPSGTVWTFTGTVDLNFQDASFTNLPPGVQQQIKDIGDPSIFSVQQLYYDLNSSDLEQGFQFNNVPSNSTLNNFMTGDFINTYWKALGGQSVLGYGAKQQTSVDPTNATTLAVTNLNFFTPDAVGTEGAPLTLNYLCAIDNNPLPDTTHAGFGWNWLEPNEAANYDGVAALNRNTFAKKLDYSLRGYVMQNCYLPWVQLPLVNGLVDWRWNMTPEQAPTVSFPATGETILSYSYKASASDVAGLNGDLGQMTLTPSFNLDVSVKGNQMTIVQHLVIYLRIQSLATPGDGNVVDIEITDTYEFAVDSNGTIVVSTPSANAKPPTSVKVDNSQTPNVNGFLNFFTGFNRISGDVATWAKSITAGRVVDIPVSNIQNFVFPGGKTFVFKDVQFSDNQDLVTHITYADV